MVDPSQGAVLFIGGMHVHDWRKPVDWLQRFITVPRMIRELERNRDYGMVSDRYCL